MSTAVAKTVVAEIEVFIRTGDADRRIFMLHGIGSDHSSFDALRACLPENVELLSWNAPGYGESTALAAQKPTAADYADKLREVTRMLGIEQFTLLGHSLGTLIAVEFAQRYSEQVSNLILLSCAQGNSVANGHPLPEKARQRLEDLECKCLQTFANERAPKLLHEPEKKPELLRAAIKAMSRINPAGYRQAVYMLAAGNLSKSASGVCLPSLTIAANEDAITPSEQSRLCHEALNAAGDGLEHRFVEIANAGHLVHQEQPHQVAQHIAEFCGWSKTNNPGSVL